MAKYNADFKLQMVMEYLNGTLSYASLAKKHHISFESQIKVWVRAYQEFGLGGLKRKHTKTSYSVQFKVNVLHFMK
jgi:transposase